MNQRQRNAVILGCNYLCMPLSIRFFFTACVHPSFPPFVNASLPFNRITCCARGCLRQRRRRRRLRVLHASGVPSSRFARMLGEGLNIVYACHDHWTPRSPRSPPAWRSEPESPAELSATSPSERGRHEALNALGESICCD